MDKKVYVLESNGRTGYYRTETARDNDYVSQDHTSEFTTTEQEYEKILFEDDKLALRSLVRKYQNGELL